MKPRGWYWSLKAAILASRPQFDPQGCDWSPEAKIGALRSGLGSKLGGEGGEKEKKEKKEEKISHICQCISDWGHYPIKPKIWLKLLMVG